MTDKELINKLSSLKEIKPDTAWKERNRDILLAQIAGGSEDKITSFFTIIDKLLPAKLLMLTSRPAMVFFLIMAIIIGGGTASLYASQETKPGDSLYIAKIISEKTQLAMTFGENDKAKLNLEFATNRTKEITQVIDEKNNQQAETVAGLTSDFKSEILAARLRLAKVQTDNPIVAAKVNNNIDNNKKNNNQPSNTDETVQVFGANNGKDANGVQISDQANRLDQVEQLFDKQDYSATINKIDEVTKNINNPEPEKPAATTTPEVKATSTDSKKGENATSTK